MGRATIVRMTWGASLGFLLIAGLLADFGCQKTDDLLEPSSDESTTIHAAYRSREEFLENPIQMDGQAIDEEWGGEAVPYHNIRISTEHGLGPNVPPQIVSVKVVYTGFNEIFFLVRWSDTTINNLKDAMVYIGESLPFELDGNCVPDLTNERNWVRNPDGLADEDRLAIAFEIDSVGSSIGSFADHGCLVACHAGQSPPFGRPDRGRLDIWQWLASRTNPVRDLFVDTDNPNDALYEIPGYLDDLFGDEVAGFSPDPGLPCYRPNFRPGSDVPIYVYRERDDPFANPLDPDRCWNQFGERCRTNNGVDMLYIWREELETIIEPFDSCDTTLVNPPDGTGERKWRYGDFVAGWYLTYPSGSRADVHGKAGYEEGVWTLEIGRKMMTDDPLHDVQFDPETRDRYLLTFAVMNNTVSVQLGSEPQILVFDPPEEGR